MPRELSDPLTNEDKEWLRSWNREDEIPDDDGEDGYDSWTVAELRTELDERGLETGGNKPDLIARLEDDDAE